MNKSDLSKIYDLLYQEADRIITQGNPCDFVDGTCVSSRKHINKDCKCCEGCKHLEVGKGCTVKSLGCKLWLCRDGASPHQYIEGYLGALRGIAIALGIPKSHRASKEEEKWR